METITQDIKTQALNKYLNRQPDNLIEDDATTKYDANLYETDEGDYMVLTDEEADARAKEYISSSLWAFNSDFIIAHSKVLDYDDGSRKILKAIQEQCESGNDAVLKLIDDLDEFIEDAINSDGRGHFMNSYDGDENEVKVNDEYFYIYRMN